MNDKNTKEEIQNELEELSKFDSFARTKISKLKELLPIIENAIQAGVSKTKIVEVLNKKGLELSLSSYSIMMKRIKSDSIKASKNKVQDKKLIDNTAEVKSSTVEERRLKWNATHEANKDDIEF